MAELQQNPWYPRCVPAKSCAVQHAKRIGVYLMSVLNLLISVRKAVADWRQRERDYAELMDLDDHSLADIGIRRSQIRDLCDGYHAPARSSAPAPVREGGKFVSPRAV